MRSDEVATVRRFNRTITQRIGALDEAYLARGRPLGASRLLWEIGETGTDSITLRRRLGLDSGYLSRLLRRLEDERLIEVGPGVGDQRVRTVRLTAAGRAERSMLDDRSDALAWSLLEPLDDDHRARLVDAMATVDRLLSAAAVTIEVEDPTSDDAATCMQAYFEELNERFDNGFDARLSLAVEAEQLVEPVGVLLVARLHGEPVGCGALKLHGAEPAEIKRVWVHRKARGLGVGRRLVRQLERWAADRGATMVHLDTNRALTEAIDLYRSVGYEEVEPFNNEPYAHHWFEKLL